MSPLSEQGDFWSGDFGDEYIHRNTSENLLASNIHFFSKALNHVSSIPKNVLEVGANIGMNIKAIKSIMPHTNFSGIEVNKKACELLLETGCNVIQGSIEEVEKIFEENESSVGFYFSRKFIWEIFIYSRRNLPD
jgi:spore coat polysaccharide biosynthesis protein SpsF